MEITIDKNKRYKKTSKMSDGCKLILSPFTGHKKWKAWNKTKEKYVLVKEDRLKQIGDHITIKRMVSKYFQMIKVHFSMVMKVMIMIMMMRIIMKIMNSSSYFRVVNKCYKMVSPVLLQELINDFAICKYCSGTLLLVQKQSPKGVL